MNETLTPLVRADHETPAGLSLGRKGFRPFFLLASAFAAVIAPLWLLVFLGVIHPGSYLVPIYWHAHEMVFGFAVAVIAGFLLTAVGNWTKQETAVGAPLLGLAVLWMAGRFAVTFATSLPRGVAAVVDLAFLPALMIALGRPIVRAKNTRNLIMVAVLGALWLANLAVHLDALGIVTGWQRRGCIVGVDIVVLLMLVMVGRVLPMFTRNVTAAASIRSHATLDRLTLAAMVCLTLLDVVKPDHALNGAVSAVVGVLATARAVHWGMQFAMRTPLLWILHFGYLWIPIGLLLRGWAVIDPAMSSSLATHALTAGAIGSLTLGMMARVTLGHTGHVLEASPWITFAFVLVTLAAVARVFGPMLLPAEYLHFLECAGILWSVAFAIYVIVDAPILLRRRVDGKPG
ncbi:MAG: NnrS family protein [Polyangiaceae bacterium]